MRAHIFSESKFRDSYIVVDFKYVSGKSVGQSVFTNVSKVSHLLQAMLSNRTVEANDGSNPCIEISDIKYEIFTVRHEKVGCHSDVYYPNA